MKSKPKKINRIELNTEISNNKDDSFVAFINGKPQLVKYQDGFVGDNEEDSDEDLIERVSKMDEDNLRELTNEEELELIEKGKFELIKKHEERICRQLDRIISSEVYVRGEDE